VRLLVTHIDEVSITNAGLKIDRVGDLAVTPSASVPNAAPEWAGTLSVAYRRGPLRLFVQERYVGKGEIDKQQRFHPLSKTKVEAAYYTDVSASYQFQTGEGRTYEVYGTINNLFNEEPPTTPNGTATTPRAANGALYDLVGRYFTAGLRFNF
jgi:outer membrane receptor protein involved in Fe transport